MWKDSEENERERGISSFERIVVINWRPRDRGREDP